MSNYNTTLQNNNSSLEEIITQLNNMPDAGEGGIDTSDATATEGDILSGKTAYVDGEKITGNIPTKTSSNLTASGATVTVPSGYYSVSASKSVGTATQATPSISVNSSGLITASATQTAGYVTAGTKSATKQLSTQGASTITPGTANKTAVVSGVYTTGSITVKGDSNLIASNIKSGVSIFGVVGTLSTSGGGTSGGNTDIEDALITRTITEYTNDRVSSIGNNAFASCASLTTVSFPECTTIGINAFASCASLTTVSFPKCTTIGSSAFISCASLTTVSFPECTSIDARAFYNCSSLTTASFPACTSIGFAAFSNCSSLTTVSFPVCTTISTYTFYSCAKLTTASFPACTTIGIKAFASCASLTTVSFPKCTTIDGDAFASCASLTTVSFPECTSIDARAFYNCSSLTTVSFPVCTTIGINAFASCVNLSKIYINTSTVCTLANSNVFSKTGITSTTGYIYVPASLSASYKKATNWSYFSNRIFSI